MQDRMVVAVCAVCVAAGFATGFWLAAMPENEIDQEVIYQVSTIDALLQGSCEGTMTFGEVKKHGDFGIATFDSLDGEMIALGGDFYQIKADGQVVAVTDDMTTPFGSVTFFSQDCTFPIDMLPISVIFPGRRRRSFPPGTTCMQFRSAESSHTSRPGASHGRRRRTPGSWMLQPTSPYSNSMRREERLSVSGPPILSGA